MKGITGSAQSKTTNGRIWFILLHRAGEADGLHMSPDRREQLLLAERFPLGKCMNTQFCTGCVLGW